MEFSKIYGVPTGLLTGIDELDLKWKGIRPKDFWLVSSYAGELKTTMMLNMAYSQAVAQNKKVQFVTLGESAETILRKLITLHSANLDLWPGSVWDDVYPLNYEDILDGTLSEKGKKFFEFLWEDYHNNPEYGKLNIYQSSGGLTCSQLKSWAEKKYEETPFDILYIDGLDTLTVENHETESTLKSLKQLAMNFKDGLGMRLISSYQLSRKGKEIADKRGGEYSLNALAFTGESEQTSTAILTVYLNDELRANNQVKIGCLKHSYRPLFKTFKAKTVNSSFKIYERIKDEEQLRRKHELYNDLITGNL